MIQDDIKNILEGLPLAIAKELDAIGEGMVDDMKNRLIQDGHVDTGELVDSIHADTKATQDEVITDICIDATNKGTAYWEFIEFGSGIYREDGTGRQTPWVYQDREGKWHTTRGFHGKGKEKGGDPFIRPAVAAHEGELNERMSLVMGDLKRYKK